MVSDETIKKIQEILKRENYIVTKHNYEKTTGVMDIKRTLTLDLHKVKPTPDKYVAVMFSAEGAYSGAIEEQIACFPIELEDVIEEMVKSLDDPLFYGLDGKHSETTGVIDVYTTNEFENTDDAAHVVESFSDEEWDKLSPNEEIYNSYWDWEKEQQQ